MSELSGMKFTHPAAIIRRAMSAEELMKLAVGRAPDPKAFEEFPPLFFPAEATNNRLDSYFTRMAQSSLKNYAAEAAAGVSFQDSHRTDGLAYMMGRTLTGEFKGAQGNGVARVVVDIYTVENLADTNNFISKYRTGIAKDVSIGFYGGRHVCSTCGLDMMTWDCWHYPGREYEVEEENADGSKTVRKEVATADVEDAHLAEVSAVYHGATPGAVILKALRDVEEGRMKPDVARFLEQRYRHLDLNLTRSHRYFAGHTPSEEGKRAMPQQRRETAAEGAGAQESEETAAGADNTGGDAGGVTNSSAGAGAATPGTQGGSETDAAAATEGGGASEMAEAGAAGGEEARMMSGLRATLKKRGLDSLTVPTGTRVLDLAADGLVYRNDLIEQALREGVRAHGADNFNREQYEKTLRAADIETIKLMKADWERQAKARFPGGRGTSDEADPPPQGQGPVPVDAPGAAFM